jgi:hypothetical protein
MVTLVVVVVVVVVMVMDPYSKNHVKSSVTLLITPPSTPTSGWQ